MRISDTCIRRPVFATVLSLVIVLVGLVAFQRLSVREYPNIDPPVVTVETTYEGASAEIIETQVTNVLEDSLAGIEGIDFMSSISREERTAPPTWKTIWLARTPTVSVASVKGSALKGIEYVTRPSVTTRQSSRVCFQLPRSAIRCSGRRAPSAFHESIATVRPVTVFTPFGTSTATTS